MNLEESKGHSSHSEVAPAADMSLVPGWSALLALVTLALINLVNYYDRMLVVVVSQPLRLEFRLTDTQYGILTGPAFVLVYAVSSLVFGYLADRRSRRAVIAGALAAWSLMTALCGMVTSFSMLVLLRAGVGLGEAGSNPAGLSMLSDHFPPKRRSTALAIFASGGALGLFSSFVLGSWMNAAYGWRTVFLVACIPGLLLAIITVTLVREPVRGRFENGGTHRVSYAGELGRLARNRALVWLCLAGAVGLFSSFGMLIWLPQFFIRSHHLSVQQVGFLFGPAAAIGVCIGMVAGGWLGDRLARRSLARPVTICIVANLVVMPLYLAVLWTPSLAAALAITLVAMAISVVFAPVFQAAMQNVCEPEFRATATAVSGVVIALVGQGLLPFLVGLASDGLSQRAGADALRWSLTIVEIAAALSSAGLFVRAMASTHAHFEIRARG